jgi:hypothetical protein
MNRSSIIELIGLPGAGKTTIVDLLIDDINSGRFVHYRDYRDEVRKGKNEKIAFAVFMIPRFISFSYLSYRLLSHCQSKKGVIKRIWKLYIILFYLHQFEKDRSGRVLLMDQGIMQMLISVLVFGKSTEMSELPRLFTQYKRIAGITLQCFRVYLTVPIQVAAERIGLRPKDSCEYKFMDKDFRDMRLSQYENAFNFVKPDLECSALDEAAINAQKIKLILA